MKMIAKYTVIIYAICINWTTIAQNEPLPRFSMAVSGGLNFSQIDGDGSRGFNKVGIQAGITGIARINNYIDMETGIHYSQRGSFSAFGNSSSADSRIHLNYIHVPVQVHFKDWNVEQGYAKMRYFFGLGYSRLLDFETMLNNPLISPDNYELNEVNWSTGAILRISRQWGLGFAYTGALSLLYDGRKFDTVNFPSMRSYFISLQAIYYLE
jgi:hypothetical protein